jgi:hypothetical protein
VSVTRSRGSAGGRLWLLAATLLALPLCLDAIGDPDLWWHLRTGQWIADNHAIPHTEMFSYTANGATWVVHEWLAEFLFWLVRSGVGLAALAVLVALVTLSGLLALALRAWRNGASGFNVGVVLLLGAKTMQPVTGTRPQMLTFALLCWTLYLVDDHLRRGGRRIWLVVPLVVFWANVHAGFAAGLALLGVALAGGLLDALWQHRLGSEQRRRILTVAVTLVVSAAAALTNPDGIGLYGLALSATSPGAHQLIQEWQPPNFTSLSMLPLLLLMVATLATMVMSRRRLRPSHVLLTVVGIAAALVAVRNIALAVALLAPVLAELLPVTYRLPGRPLVLPLTATVATVLAVIVSVVHVAQDTSDAALARQFPVCLLNDLRASGQQVNLWLPYGQAGFAIDATWPQVHVYAYGEDNALGATVIANYVRIAAGVVDQPTALQLLATSRTNAVITVTGSLARELLGAGWVQVATAGDQVLLTAPTLHGVGAVSCSAG